MSVRSSRGHSKQNSKPHTPVPAAIGITARQPQRKHSELMKRSKTFQPKLQSRLVRATSVKSSAGASAKSEPKKRVINDKKKTLNVTKAIKKEKLKNQKKPAVKTIRKTQTLKPASTKVLKRICFKGRQAVKKPVLKKSQTSVAKKTLRHSSTASKKTLSSKGVSHMSSRIQRSKSLALPKKSVSKSQPKKQVKKVKPVTSRKASASPKKLVVLGKRRQLSAGVVKKIKKDLKN